MRALRSDALPEDKTYTDTGCELYRACLSCPLPKCRYDMPFGVRTMRNAKRDDLIRAARNAGVGVDTIAEAAGIARRTVYRVLEALS